jgi:hypothetical protein
MATQYKLTGHYDQPRVDPDEWVAQGRPVGAYPTRTYRPGDVIEFRNDEERDRLVSLGVVEEVEQESSREDQQRQVDERRKEQESEQRQASKAAGGKSKQQS